MAGRTYLLGSRLLCGRRRLYRYGDGGRNIGFYIPERNCRPPVVWPDASSSFSAVRRVLGCVGCLGGEEAGKAEASGPGLSDCGCPGRCGGRNLGISGSVGVGIKIFIKIFSYFLQHVGKNRLAVPTCCIFLFYVSAKGEKSGKMCLIFWENEDIMYWKSLFLACFWSLEEFLRDPGRMGERYVR